jgi:hypothetical protein
MSTIGTIITTAAITTPAGHRIEARLGSRGVSLWQDGPFAGTGRWDGRDVECPAILGASDGSECDTAYDAIGAALRAAVAELDGALYAVDTGTDGDDEMVVADSESDALAIVGVHAQPGADLDGLRARGWAAARVGA